MGDLIYKLRWVKVCLILHSNKCINVKIFMKWKAYYNTKLKMKGCWANEVGHYDIKERVNQTLITWSGSRDLNDINKHIPKSWIVEGFIFGTLFFKST